MNEKRTAKVLLKNKKLVAIYGETVGKIVENLYLFVAKCNE